MTLIFGVLMTSGVKMTFTNEMLAMYNDVSSHFTECFYIKAKRCKINASFNLH